ncbi:hypothetical protein JTE90_002354 [Oedothorax gibbosus]|uniref:Secreted protein n=1 Tax=Oedothorax gibbosus TaxID=931172 RepID=A0AAV6ULH5_9ARAC|nr:hypothetical protein JTE90_002354 [Oedothorax gibbosus]
MLGFVLHRLVTLSGVTGDSLARGAGGNRRDCHGDESSSGAAQSRGRAQSQKLVSWTRAGSGPALGKVRHWVLHSLRALQVWHRIKRGTYKPPRQKDGKNWGGGAEVAKNKGG